MSAANAPELPAVDTEEEFFEGRLLTAHHSWRERRPKLRRLLIASREKDRKLECEGCGWNGGAVDAQIARSGFEAHHLAPLAETGPAVIKLKDVALLCATCHRLTHRWIALNGEWLSREAIAKVVSPSQS